MGLQWLTWLLSAWVMGVIMADISAFDPCTGREQLRAGVPMPLSELEALPPAVGTRKWGHSEGRMLASADSATLRVSGEARMGTQGVGEGASMASASWASPC